MCVDYDPPEVHNARMVRAAKPHRCVECGRAIEIGERHEYVFGVWEGQPDSHRTCGQCHAARSWLNRVCHGWIYGGVLDDLGEHWSEAHGARTVAMGRLIVLARTRWTRSGRTWTADEVQAIADEAYAAYRRAWQAELDRLTARGYSEQQARLLLAP